jgi:phosphonate transport system substrate-binding protein
MGPASYVKTFHTYGEKTLLARLEVNGKPFYRGMIVIRQDSPIKSLDGLKGKTFAFGDPNSTMSHLVPTYMLLEESISVNSLKSSAFLGSHNNVALGVLGGYYDAGGVKEGVYFKYKDRGLKLLAQSPPVSEHLFVARKDLPQETIETLRQAMFQLKDKTVLESIKGSVTGLVPVKIEDYDYLFSVMKELNKLSSE